MLMEYSKVLRLRQDLVLWWWVRHEPRPYMYRRFQSCQESNWAMAMLGLYDRESEAPLSELAASRLLFQGRIVEKHAVEP